MEFFETIPALLRTFWFIAIPVSLIFLIQTIMSFVGANASDGINADFDGDFDGSDAPFQLFSLRNLINFLLGLSWSGISLYSSIPNATILITVSVVIGILFLYLFFIVIKQIQKLAENNSFKITETIGKTAEVYLNIPPTGEGKGKVIVSVRGSIHELDAITKSDTAIKSNSTVKITGLETANILIVEKINL